MTDANHIITPDIRTPAPNRYMLPPLLGKLHHDLRRTIQPAFTMQGRRAPDRLVPSPAPQRYQTENLTRYGNVEAGRVLPALKGKALNTAPHPLPGPQYDVTPADKLTFTGPPGYKLGNRIKETASSKGPGPKYGLPTLIDGTGHVPNMKSSPAFTLSGKIVQRKNSIGPSPLNYGPVAPEKYMPNSAPTHKILGE